MKIKLGLIYGVLIWFLLFLITIIFEPILKNTAYINLIIPTSIIIFTGFFGILYIREFDKNEVIEGIGIGILFVIIDIILDFIFFILPHNENILVADFTNHVITMTLLTLIITTLLGYLAQMKIELK